MMKKFLKRNIVFLLVSAVAVSTMCYSNSKATLAAKTAPTIKSAVYEGTVAQKQIGVSLLENGVIVASRDNTETLTDNEWVYGGTQLLLENMLPEGESFVLGKTYPEELRVQNTGNIPEYVRLIIHKYWEKVDLENPSKVEKQPELNPNFIDLNIINVNASCWKTDPNWPDASHPETIILYYNKILQPGDITEPATDTLRVSGLTAKYVWTETEGNITRTKYDYDGIRFVVEAEADAVQTHNAHDALTSAWGVDPAEFAQVEYVKLPEQNSEQHQIVPVNPEENGNQNQQQQNLEF